MTVNLTFEDLANKGLIDSSWVNQLLPVQSVLDQIAQRLNQEIDAGEQILPAPPIILRAFTIPFDQVKVVIVGQDPRLHVIAPSRQSYCLRQLQFVAFEERVAFRTLVFC